MTAAKIAIPAKPINAAKPAKAANKTVKVTLFKSVIGAKRTHRACVQGLGLRRINHTVEVLDTPSNRGMINKVSYLVKCEG